MGIRNQASDTQNFVWQKFHYGEKGQKASNIDIRRGDGECPPSLVLARELYTSSVGCYSKSKECLEVVKVLPDPFPQLTF